MGCLREASFEITTLRLISIRNFLVNKGINILFIIVLLSLVQALGCWRRGKKRASERETREDFSRPFFFFFRSSPTTGSLEPSYVLLTILMFEVPNSGSSLR